MSDHLPECPSSSPDPLAADCCCSRLSAVERRTLDAAREAIAGLPEVAGWTGELAIIRKPIALDAIDALKEKQ